MSYNKHFGIIELHWFVYFVELQWLKISVLVYAHTILISVTAFVLD